MTRYKEIPDSHFLTVFNKVNGNWSEAARMIGVQRLTLVRKFQDRIVCNFGLKEN